MRFGPIVLTLLLCATVGAAKEVKVRKAWVRTFPNTSLQIFPDNLGRIAAVGTETNSGVALLLNKSGRQVAKVAVRGCDAQVKRGLLREGSTVRVTGADDKGKAKEYHGHVTVLK